MLICSSLENHVLNCQSKNLSMYVVISEYHTSSCYTPRDDKYHMQNKVCTPFVLNLMLMSGNSLEDPAHHA